MNEEQGRMEKTALSLHQIATKLATDTSCTDSTCAEPHGVEIQQSSLCCTVVAPVQEITAGLLTQVYGRTYYAIEIAHLLFVHETIIHSCAAVQALFNHQTTFGRVAWPPDRKVYLPVEIRNLIVGAHHSHAGPGESELERSQHWTHYFMPTLLCKHILPDTCFILCPPNVADKDQITSECVQKSVAVCKVCTEEFNSICFAYSKRGWIVQMKLYVRKQLRQKRSMDSRRSSSINCSIL